MCPVPTFYTQHMISLQIRHVFHCNRNLNYDVTYKVDLVASIRRNVVPASPIPFSTISNMDSFFFYPYVHCLVVTQ